MLAVLEEFWFESVAYLFAQRKILVEVKGWKDILLLNCLIHWLDTWILCFYVLHALAYIYVLRLDVVHVPIGGLWIILSN